MRILELKPVEHNWKTGDACPAIEPNVTDDTLLTSNGVPIGFFLRQLPAKAKALATLADSELRSDRVPKSTMDRITEVDPDPNRGTRKYLRVKQYSTILGSVAPRPHLRRAYANTSTVHSHKTAQPFIKAMLMLCVECEEILRSVMPEQHATQTEIMASIARKWRFGNLFTSSISNFNISAAFHQDRANVKNTVNLIVTKRQNSIGGNLHVPDYGLTFDQVDGSLLAYPAWRNMHAVTEIEPSKLGGYRNSLVFYPLAAFLNTQADTADSDG
jgi:hypothetical protein